LKCRIWSKVLGDDDYGEIFSDGAVKEKKRASSLTVMEIELD